MTENTALQIENMKSQTFGVEIEGNNITRQKAAKVAAEFFGTGRYEYTASRNGYMTWSAWDAEGREWKFQRDVSIDGPDEQKCEMVTPILTNKDMELLQNLVRTLRKAGMKSDATRGCGVHIHIGAKGHTPQTLRNLVNIMAAHESQLAKAIKIDRYEGYPYYYYKKELEVNVTPLEGGEPMNLTAMVYIMADDHTKREPDAFYYKVLLNGYLNFKFPLPILEQALADSIGKRKAVSWLKANGMTQQQEVTQDA